MEEVKYAKSQSKHNFYLRTNQLHVSATHTHILKHNGDVLSKNQPTNKHSLTFRGPCIVIYSYNKSQRDALFLKFILIKNSTWSSILTLLADSQHN